MPKSKRRAKNIEKVLSKHCLKYVAYGFITKVGEVGLSFAGGINLLTLTNSLSKSYDSAVEGVKEANISG
jgi:hypothetical protein